jgi:RNA recognition motif-containing protein
MTIFFSNMPYRIGEDELVEAIREFGVVDNCRIIVDGEGRSRGFGFVEMLNADEALSVIDRLHGCDWDGRTLCVKEAYERGILKLPRHAQAGGR